MTNKARYRNYRRRQSGSWIEGGTWFLVRSHVSKRNPEF